MAALSPTLLWFRQDLRLQDNPALHAALARGGAVVPVYVLDEAGEWGWAPGAAARWWLHRSLAALDASLRERGSRLLLARGDAETVLPRLVRETGAGAVYWNRRYELCAVARDGWLEMKLGDAGVEVRTWNASVLHEPHAIANRQGRPFQVFTPYWRHCLGHPVGAPLKLKVAALPAPAAWPRSLELAELELQVPPGGRCGEPADGPEHDAAGSAPRPDYGAWWQPGEAAAAGRLRRFVAHAMEAYAAQRDFPARDGTSRLSPHLHFGEISARQIWAAVRAAGRESGVFPPGNGARVFLAELGWREFAHHLLFNFPHTTELPLRDEFARFPWAADPGGKKFRAWREGRTGYPIVDAAMRQLRASGWMHNRTRMIAASFLVKHLRLPWRSGAAWFWERLLDADLASNTLGWQWSAGCGADAAPYFRIFAPVLQGRKFDPDGAYVRRWVPELARVPAEHIHAPWDAPAHVLGAAGVTLGETYPRPIVEHAAARNEALAAFRAMRGAGWEREVFPIGAGAARKPHRV
jgi:deoxyribodipyrimidine photo-lyase